MTGLYSETGHRVHLNYGRELETGRTTQIYADREIAAPYTLTDLRYTYNDAGDITKVTDLVTTPDDTQCFIYDYLRRLKKAWTPTSGDCAATPTSAGLGGPAPYWHSWQYDDAGNRIEQVEHATATGDKTTTYDYPDPGTSQPHRLLSTTTVDSTGSVTANYVHDAAGNMTTRPVPGGNQVITWYPEGRIGSATSPGGNTAYLDDADGNRLVNRETGVKTLFLPGQELRYTSATGAKVGTRYYTHGGVLVASRTGSGVTWLVADHQSTQTIAVEASTQAITQRRQTPFGTARGTSPTWVNNRGFVGGINDRNALVHLGAREYDPALGRFLTVDPVFDATDPQQWNGYSYAENSPITKSDPTGLFSDAGGDGYGGGGTGCDQACKKEAPKRLVKNTEEEITKTRAVANSSPMDEVKKLLPDLAMELTPLGDIKGCFDGDLLSCLGLLPIGKAFKLIRAAGRIIDAFQTARRLINAARARLGALQERLAAYQRYADEVGQAAGKCEHSFDPKTHVLMADGTTKPISEVAIGDAVVATDPETGGTHVRLVTEQHLNDDSDLTDLVVVAADGSKSTLKTTQHHPFWDQTDQQWVDAGQLTTGHQLRTHDGEIVEIAEVTNYTGARQMHDLTVEQTHTYYVVAGTTPVLVHNCGGQANVYLHAGGEHVSISVTHNGKTIHSQAGSKPGYDVIPSHVDPSEIEPGTEVLTIDLPDAEHAQSTQEVLMGVNLGAHDLNENNCVTYCARILNAGGYHEVNPGMGSENIMGRLENADLPRRRI